MKYDHTLPRGNKEIHRKIFFNEIDKLDKLYGDSHPATTNQNENVRAIAIDSTNWSMARILYAKRCENNSDKFVHVAFFNLDSDYKKDPSNEEIFSWAKYGIFINKCDMYKFLIDDNITTNKPLGVVWYDGMSAWDNRYRNTVESPNTFFNTLTSDRLRSKLLSLGCMVLVTLDWYRHNADKKYGLMIQNKWIKNNSCGIAFVFATEYNDTGQRMQFRQYYVQDRPMIPVVVDDDAGDSSDGVEIVSIKHEEKKRTFDTISNGSEDSDDSEEWSDDDDSCDLFIDNEQFRKAVRKINKINHTKKRALRSIYQ